MQPSPQSGQKGARKSSVVRLRTSHNDPSERDHALCITSSRAQEAHIWLTGDKAWSRIRKLAVPLGAPNRPSGAEKQLVEQPQDALLL